jgi:hypothetical protein
MCCLVVACEQVGADGVEVVVAGECGFGLGCCELPQAGLGAVDHGDGDDAVEGDHWPWHQAVQQLVQAEDLVARCCGSVRPRRRWVTPAAARAREHLQLIRKVLSRPLDPPHPGIPVPSGLSDCAKALVNAGMVGAGGVEPPSSSVSANHRGTAVRTAVPAGRARP